MATSAASCQTLILYKAWLIYTVRRWIMPISTLSFPLCQPPTCQSLCSESSNINVVYLLVILPSSGPVGKFSSEKTKFVFSWLNWYNLIRYWAQFNKPNLLNRICTLGNKPNTLKQIHQIKFTKLNLIHQAKCVRCEDSNILNQIYQSKSIQSNLQN